MRIGDSIIEIEDVCAVTVNPIKSTSPINLGRAFRNVEMCFHLRNGSVAKVIIEPEWEDCQREKILPRGLIEWVLRRPAKTRKYQSERITAAPAQIAAKIIEEIKRESQ